MELARRILGSLPHGVEIGASAFNPFPGVRAWNLDTIDNGMFQRAQVLGMGRAVRVDVHASAERMPFRDGALDFVLASHVIEHMPDTIRALGEWDRVLRPGGVCFLIVPHRERTTDRPRPRTDLLHHLADYALGTTAATDAMVPSSHYHVWHTQDFVALVEFLCRRGFLDWQIEVVEDVDSKVGNGFTVVAKKRAAVVPLPQAPDGEVAFHLLTPVLPFQVVNRSLDVVVPGPTLPRELPVPAGRWRVAPIHSGFPPRAGTVRVVDVGAPHAQPRLASSHWRGTVLHLGGEHLTPLTWLEGRYVDGSEHRVLPMCVDGELRYDFDGVPMPDAFYVRAVAPGPGGGPGNVLAIERHPLHGAEPAAAARVDRAAAGDAAGDAAG